MQVALNQGPQYPGGVLSMSGYTGTCLVYRVPFEQFWYDDGWICRDIPSMEMGGIFYSDIEMGGFLVIGMVMGPSKLLVESGQHAGPGCWYGDGSLLWSKACMEMGCKFM